MVTWSRTTTLWTALWLLSLGTVLAQQSQEKARLELPYEKGTVVIEARSIFRDTAQLWVAEGEVVVTFQDSVLRSERLTYEPAAERIVSDSPFELTQGIQWLKGSRGEFDLTDDTGVIDDAEGYAEELFIRTPRLLKTGPRTYKAQDGFLTACQDAIPKWSFRIQRASLNVDKHATLTNTVLKIKQVPIFYFPWLLVPTGKKERSSGFMLPTYGNSSNKGRRLGETFYLVLGRSADLQLRTEYFSKRGWGQGLAFRARPNAQTFIDLDAYTIDDRLNQGGTSFNGTAETRFGDGYRAVADFNLVSNFIFRRVFSDSFFTATRPSEESRLFLTRNSGPLSLNLRLAREETVFPVSNAVIRHGPTVNARVTGWRPLEVPIYFDFDATAEGVGRDDSRINTPTLSQRLDFFPRAYVSVPLFQGLRITPRLGFRQTYYGTRLGQDEDGKVQTVNQDLHREYLDFTLDLQGWGLSKVYGSGDSAWKHLIEPSLKYRWTSGIDEFNDTIIYDEEDAIADTNEVEFAIFNRFFRRRGAGGVSTSEFLSIKIGQKYFLDPDFGGAFVPGQVRQFFPLTTLTGFPYGSIRRNLSPLTTVARINPGFRYSFDVRADYDWDFSRFRNISVTGYYNRNLFSFGTTYFLTQELEPGTAENNQLQGTVIYGSRDRGFSFASVFSYDARSKDFLNVLGRFNYFWDCCGISGEVQRLSLGLREEREFRFSFFLKGIGAFGTIRRPESVF